MRVHLAIAMLLATVAVAVVAVCQYSDACRLRYRVWEAQRQRDSLRRQVREIEAALAARATPRRMLEMEDRFATDRFVAPVHVRHTPPPARTPEVVAVPQRPAAAPAPAEAPSMPPGGPPAAPQAGPQASSQRGGVAEGVR